MDNYVSKKVEKCVDLSIRIAVRSDVSQTISESINIVKTAIISISQTSLIANNSVQKVTELFLKVKS